jgi:hypothetical protein
VGTPSCADVAFLLLEGLEEELERLFPVCSALDLENETFCDRHFDYVVGVVPDNEKLKDFRVLSKEERRELMIDDGYEILLDFPSFLSLTDLSLLVYSNTGPTRMSANS